MAEIDVPIIDVSAFVAGGDDAGAKNVVAAIKEAAEKCGFLMIKGHGVPQEVIDAAWRDVRAFFDQPLELKNETPMTPDYPYGYSGLLTEKAGNDKGGGSADKGYDTSDLKESFQVCLSSAASPAADLPTPLWPRAPEGFKDSYTAYYRAMEQLASHLLRAFAAVLELPADFFAPYCVGHWCSLRSLNYPELSSPPNPGQLRIAAHSDYGSLTILRADDAPGGLQVLRSDGSWMDVVIPPDCFCVNLGDLMQRWTNDAWRSTVHRVVTPPANPGRPTRRQSMAFFHNLAKDAVVSTIPTCITPERPAKYEPIRAFDHLMERHARATGAAKAFQGAKA